MSERTEVDLAKMELGDFLNDLASGQPTPGGGSAAALTGALGASLSSMVANLTVGREDYKEVEESFQEILEEANSLRHAFLVAIGEDIEAYEKVMDAYSLPDGTKEEKDKRKKAIESALKSATVPPFKIAELGIDVIGLSKECAASGNNHAVTDAGASAILAKATVSSALLNVDINLSSISDPNFVEEKRRKRNELGEKSAKKTEKVLKVMSDKI